MKSNPKYKPTPKTKKRVVHGWMCIGEDGEPAYASKRDNYIQLSYRKKKRPTTSHEYVPVTIHFTLPARKKTK